MKKPNPDTLTVTMDLLPDKFPEAEYMPYFLIDTLPSNEMLLGQDPDVDFLRSVLRMGVLVPILVVKTPNIGSYYVASGRRRIKAARACGLMVIKAFIFPVGTPLEVLTLVENNQRKSNPASELAAIESLVKEHNATEKDIAIATGMDIGTIRKREKLTTLIPTLREYFDKGGMNADTAQRISSLSAPEQDRFLEESAEQIQKDGKITAKTVSDFFRVRKDDAARGLPEDMFANLPEQPTHESPSEWTQERTYQLVMEGEEQEEQREPMRAAHFPASYLPYLEFLIRIHPDKADAIIVGESLKLMAEYKGYTQTNKEAN